MTLSKTQEEEQYNTPLETAKDISWIREQMQTCGNTQKDQADKITELEVDHSLLKGKLRAFILGFTFIISLLVNGVLWMLSRLWVK